MAVKIELAKSIIADFHSAARAAAAEAEFIRVFRNKETPDDAEVAGLDADEALVDFIVRHDILASRGEVKRIHAQGGIYLDNERPAEITFTLKKGQSYLLKIGKRKFVKIKPTALFAALPGQIVDKIRLASRQTRMWGSLVIFRIYSLTCSRFSLDRASSSFILTSTLASASKFRDYFEQQLTLAVAQDFDDRPPRVPDGMGQLASSSFLRRTGRAPTTP